MTGTEIRAKAVGRCASYSGNTRKSVLRIFSSSWKRSKSRDRTDSKQADLVDAGRDTRLRPPRNLMDKLGNSVEVRRPPAAAQGARTRGGARPRGAGSGRRGQRSLVVAMATALRPKQPHAPGAVWLERTPGAARGGTAATAGPSAMDKPVLCAFGAGCRGLRGRGSGRASGGSAFRAPRCRGLRAPRSAGSSLWSGGAAFWSGIHPEGVGRAGAFRSV